MDVVKQKSLLNLSDCYLIVVPSSQIYTHFDYTDWSLTFQLSASNVRPLRYASRDLPRYFANLCVVVFLLCYSCRCCYFVLMSLAA